MATEYKCPYCDVPLKETAAFSFFTSYTCPQCNKSFEDYNNGKLKETIKR